MINPTFDMLNQRGTPMFFSDVFANRPTAAIVGRIFVSTDTYELYRDTGTAWDLLSGPGSGTITGSGTAFKYPVFTASSVIGNGSIEQLSTKNQSTRDFEIKTSTDDGLSESELILTNRFSGVDDTITFQYGRTILAGTPFLKIQDNNLTYPTSKLTYQGGNFTITDSLLVVTNTLQNNVADFYASAPELKISATGVGQRATLILAPSIGAFAGTISTGSALNTLEFQTGVPSVTRLTIGATGDVGITSNLTVDTNTLFVDATNNRVGVGTTSPSYKLDVQGTSGTVGIRSLSNTAGDILFYATGTVTGSLNAFTTAINATGNVVATLQNNNTATGSATLDINVTATSTGDPYISFTTSGATNWSLGIDNSDSDKLKFGPVSNPSLAGANTLVLHTTGNTSLGAITDTGEKLQVTGTMKVTGASTFNSTVTVQGDFAKTYSDATVYTGTVEISKCYIYNTSNTTGAYSAISLFTNNVSGDSGSVSLNAISNATNRSADFAIVTRHNNVYSEKFRIASTGAATFSSSVQVGGGTTSAGAILQADSTTQGFLPPRMTSTQRNNIGTLVAGLIVYDTTLNKLYVYTNAWEQITSI